MNPAGKGRGPEPGDKDLFESMLCYFKRLFSFFIALTGALLAYQVLPLGSIREQERGSTLSTFVCFALFVVAIVVRVVLAKRADKTERWKIDLGDQLVAKDENDKLEIEFIDSIRTSMTLDEITQLTEIVSDPGKYVVRITETVDVSARRYISEASRTVVFPSSDSRRRLFVPILRPKKGRLVDALAVRCEGKRVRTLSNRESRGALLAVVSILINIVHKDTAKRSALYECLRRQILSDTPANESTREAETKNLEDRIGVPVVEASDAERLAALALRAILRQSFESYVIIALVEGVQLGDTHLKIVARYSQDRIATAKTSDDKNWLRRSVDQVYRFARLTFGLTRRSHVIHTPLALEAQSYHLRVPAPEGLYVYNHGLDRAVLKRSVGEEIPRRVHASRPISPALRLSNTVGLDHIHAYARDLDVAMGTHVDNGTQTTATHPVVVFELRERPPGLLFAIWLLSIYLTCLVVGVSVYHDLIFGFDWSNIDKAKCTTGARSAYLQQLKDPAACEVPLAPKSSWPTVLFGAPAIVSAWLVSRFTQAAVANVSLSTIAVASWGIFNAVFAVGIAALKFTLPMVFPVSLFNMWISQPLWIALLVSCVAHTVLVTILLPLRVYRYAKKGSHDKAYEEKVV